MWTWQSCCWRKPLLSVTYSSLNLAEEKSYSYQELQQLELEHKMFRHAFTGCDTTSVVFRRSKAKFAKSYKKDRTMKEAAEVFTSPLSIPSDVERAGTILHKIKFDISTLPPNEEATKYHQIQEWMETVLSDLWVVGIPGW
ncbi:hypothetical protein JTB14_019014 [Gonioctena quinquepunctata]|nr:hypothetical protein JTB14_019014 [Gonioctena quinquepunctata]